MEVKILSKKDNPVLKRKEISFSIEHGPKGKTPGRLEVRKNLAAGLGINEELVFVENMRTMTGTNTSVGVANVYDNKNHAVSIEPEHIVKRNSPPEKPKQEAKA
jgi:ribosomal protein S24E